MASLWEYINGNVQVDKNSPATAKAAYAYTAFPRLLANSGKSVYDSFKRGMVNPNIEDAFNVASMAMVGGMPGVPKGNSPGTLGMAFRSPKDVVYTHKGEFNPTSQTLKEDFGDNYDLYNLISRYHNKTWGTVDDPVIKHIDKGFKVPEIPGLDAYLLNNLIANASEMMPSTLEHLVKNNPRYTYQIPLQAKTNLGKYVEAARDEQEILQNMGITNKEHMSYSRGTHQKTKDYAINTDGVNVFSKPEISSLASIQLPYKIEGNLNRMSLADMLMQATEKEAALARIPDEQLHVFDDGHYWTQLKTQAQREAESEAMGNSTRLPMHDDKDLYSLRDKNGKSILTASKPKDGLPYFSEIQTRFNKDDILWKYRTNESTEYDSHVKALADLLKIEQTKWK